MICAGAPPTPGPLTSAARSISIRFATADRSSLGVRRAEPITVGVPLPKGACVDARHLTVVDADGSPVALQTRVLDRWTDGSVRWALLDFQAVVQSATDAFSLIVGNSVPEAGARSAIVWRDADGVLEIDTGRAVFSLRRGHSARLDRDSLVASRGDLFQSVAVDGVPIIAPERTGFSVHSSEGPCAVAFDEIAIEEAGSIRTVVRARGRAIAPDASTLVDLDLRLHFFSGLSTVRIVATVRNPRAATHPGGFWELGDPGSVYLRDAAFSVGLADSSASLEPWCSETRDQAATPASLPLEIYQESSGGAEWQHPNHRNREGVVPLRWRGYRLRSGGSESRGDRATPIVGLGFGALSVAVTLPAFWQNFPKAIEATSHDVVVRLFPPQSGDVHELQGGEQKTHTFYIAFGGDGVTPVPLDWCRAPLRAIVPPSWYEETRAVPYLTQRPDGPRSEYHTLIDAGLQQTHGFAAKREIIDEYGWRNFGDLYADHETMLQPDARLVSHYNNQYDAVAGFASQFMRTGDVRWWELMDDLARHVVDIDIYHTDQDKSAYNHALFWHTYHYVDAGLSTHRSYPKSPRVGGGGPSNEHNYATGLVLHHFLTGDPLTREGALELARWVVSMDDGRQTVFRWVARSATGLASQTSSAEYHGPGRGAGHSIRALLDGHRLSGDSLLLRKAEELIRRVVHPNDDLIALNLFDTERRWSYTACLQALGAYLDVKAERDEHDEMYAYARASLLHYAEWMAPHEYPYLEKPELLEYPTETWAAQDLRKSDVFYFAARHSEGAARARYAERASFFFTTAVETLAKMPTRTLTRPLVLLLSHGTLHGWVRRYGLGDPAPPGGVSQGTAFGSPACFVTQKQRVKRRLAAVAAAGLVALAIGLLSVLYQSG